MDIPFAEEACGDQFLLRDDRVLRLAAETGDVAEASPDLGTFLGAVRDEGIQRLGLAPLLAFQSEGHRLLPGQLLSVYPPFCTKEAARGVSLRAVPAHQRLSFLAELARQLRDVPDGGHVEFKTTP